MLRAALNYCFICLSFFENRHIIWGNFKFNFVIFWIKLKLEISNEAYSFKRGKRTIHYAFLFGKASSQQSHSTNTFCAPTGYQWNSSEQWAKSSDHWQNPRPPELTF